MEFRFKKFHWYIVPLVSMVTWWGMLIALMAAWSIQGRPIYAFMRATKQDPVYISDIGATNLQPIFISCSIFQAIFFVGTMVMDHYLRTFGKLQGYISRKQPTIALIAIALAIVGQLGIIFVSIFNTHIFPKVHSAMLVVFIVFLFCSCCFNFLNTFIYGWYSDRLQPEHQNAIFGEKRWHNIYFVSFVLKVFWLAAASLFALCFLGFNIKGDGSTAAIFEWTLSFFYGVLLIMWSIDLFPSAIRHYRRKNGSHEESSLVTDASRAAKEGEETVLNLEASAASTTV